MYTDIFKSQSTLFQILKCFSNKNLLICYRYLKYYSNELQSNTDENFENKHLPNCKSFSLKKAESLGMPDAPFLSLPFQFP